MQKEESKKAAIQKAKLIEEKINAKKSDPVYQKKKRIDILLVFVSIIVCIALFVLALQIKENTSYKKDLSSIFGVSLDASIEDIIEFEASEYGHTEYNKVYTYDGEELILEFAPYITNDGEFRYKHRYFFYLNSEKLSSIEYGDIITSEKDDGVKCTHIFEIKKRALKISSTWDENKYDGLFLIMHGQIDGIKCRVQYQCGAIESICLFIDNKQD